eukprot:217766_1
MQLYFLRHCCHCNEHPNCVRVGQLLWTLYAAHFFFVESYYSRAMSFRLRVIWILHDLLTSFTSYTSSYNPDGIHRSKIAKEPDFHRRMWMFNVRLLACKDVMYW